MHGVCSEALAVDAMVAQHMPVKAIVVPHLLDAVILKKLLEDVKHLFASSLHMKLEVSLVENTGAASNV